MCNLYVSAWRTNLQYIFQSVNCVFQFGRLPCNTRPVRTEFEAHAGLRVMSGVFILRGARHGRSRTQLFQPSPPGPLTTTTTSGQSELLIRALIYVNYVQTRDELFLLFQKFEYMCDV
jgi:hypothetical protein